MAKPTTLKWTQLTIWPGDGASPEDFTSQVCGLTAKGFSITGTPAETEVPDCVDPDDPIWMERVIRNLSSGFSGSGVMAQETFPFWRDWMLGGETKNVRIVVGITPAGYFEGRFLLTTFELTGNLEDAKVQVNLEAASDGPVVWSAGAP